MTSLERLSAARALVPAAWVMPSLSSLWGLALGTRDVADGAPRALRDHDRLWEAFARDELSLRDPVRVAGRVAPAGRHLAASLLPALVRDEALGVAWSRARLAGWLHTVGTTLHVEVASRCAVALERLGDAWLSRSGASWCLDDLRGPPGRDAILAHAMDKVAQSQRDYDVGEITDGERYNRCVDDWTAAFTRLGDAVRADQRGTTLDALRVAMTAGDASARLTPLCAAVGLVTKPWGELVERPVWRSFGEGLDAHGFFLRARQRRAQETGERERLREVDALFGELCDALGGWRVTSVDCGDDAGQRLRANDNHYGAGPTLFERAERRVMLRDVVNARGDVVARAGETVGSRHATAWIGVTEVTLRTALTCRDAEGVCARCYGLDPDDGTAVHAEDPVGLRAAWSIARTVARLPARWAIPYWIGSSCEGPQSHRSAPFRATVHPDGDDLFARRRAVRAGVVTLIDDDGARAVLPVDEGDELGVDPGATVARGGVVLFSSPWHARVHVAKVAAGVRARVELAHGSAHDDLVERSSDWDLSTGWYVRRGGTVTLALRSLDDGRIACEIPLSGDEGPIPLGAVVERGDVVVATRRSHLGASFGAEDLSVLRHRLDLSATGYNRRPATRSPCDGVVVEASPRRIVVRRDDGTTFRVVRRQEHLAVREGEVVRVGDVLVPGRESLPRHLRLFGVPSTAQRIVGVLAFHAAEGGEALASVHVEILARAMLAWRRVRRPGDTGLRRNAVLSWAECARIQRETLARGERPAEVVTVLRGVGRMAGRAWRLTHRAQVERRRRRAR